MFTTRQIITYQARWSGLDHLFSWLHWVNASWDRLGQRGQLSHCEKITTVDGILSEQKQSLTATTVFYGLITESSISVSKLEVCRFTQLKSHYNKISPPFSQANNNYLVNWLFNEELRSCQTWDQRHVYWRETWPGVWSSSDWAAGRHSQHGR